MFQNKQTPTPQISIIIPVYNAEYTLKRCLDSVLAQTFTNWECLIIDDGSIDNSEEVIHKFVKKDHRFKAFLKKNGGVSSARNLGLDNATGEYITFLDADDWLDADFLSELMKHNADLIVGAYETFQDNKNEIEKELLGELHFNTSKEWKVWMVNVMTSPLFLAPWGKAFRRKTIGDIRFLLGQRLGEDVHFIHRYLNGCRSLTVTNKAEYHYQQSNISKYSMPLKDSLWHLANMYVSYAELGIKSSAWAKFHVDLFWEISKNEIVKNPKTWFCTPCVQELYKQARPFYTWRKILKIRIYRFPYILPIFHKITGKYF